MKQYNWGIIGAGTIVRKFVKGMLGVKEESFGANRGRVYGIVNRSRDNAEKFAAEVQEWNPKGFHPKVYDSVEAMLEDPDIDVVYIGVTNEMHALYMKACILHRKPVICEKPFTLNADEARDIAMLAKENQVFCMEAMWSAFLPVWNQVKQEIEEGIIGNIRYMDASFGFDMPVTIPGHRLFDPEKGGGALMDVGVYPLFFILDAMKTKPSKIQSNAVMGMTGVDEICDVEMIYENVTCHASAAIRANLGTSGRIYGEKGEIAISRHYAAEEAVITYWKQDEEGFSQCQKRIDIPFEVNGYEYEAAEVMDCIEKGWIESPRHPLQKTIELMELVDEASAQWK